MKEKVKSYIDSGTYMYLCIGIVALCAIMGIFLPIKNINHEQMVDVIIYGIGLGIVWFIANRRQQSFLAQSIHNKLERNFIKRIVVLIISLFIININLNFLLLRLQPLQEQVVKWTAIQGKAMNEFILIEILTTAIIIPIIEEILFRGFIYQTLNKRLSVRYTIMLQGILFGLIHIKGLDTKIMYINIAAILNATILGITYGYVLYKSKSLWSGVIMHMINNFLCIILPKLPDSIIFNTYFNIGMLFIGVIGVCTMFKRIEEYSLPKSSYMLTEQRG